VRQWHRRISLVVGVFMLFIALTGALLQGETMLAGRGNAGGPPAGMRAPAAVSDDEVRALLATSLAGARRLSAGTLMGIELRLVGTPTAEVVVAEPALRKLRLDARTGAPLDASSQPGRRDLHAVLLDLHRGIRRQRGPVGQPGVRRRADRALGHRPDGVPAGLAASPRGRTARLLLVNTARNPFPNKRSP